MSKEQYLLDDTIWDAATSFHLLRLLKILDIDSKFIAVQIGTHAPLVSMWLHGKRAIPTHFRPRLEAIARCAYAETLGRAHLTWQTLPTETLKQAASAAFYAPIHQWHCQVQYETERVGRDLRACLHRLSAYSNQPHFTSVDYQTIARLAAEVQVLARTAPMSVAEASSVS
jgi:hypothetical protein